jgi:hypothetical protein
VRIVGSCEGDAEGSGNLLSASRVKTEFCEVPGTGIDGCLECCKESVVLKSGTNVGGLEKSGRMTVAINTPPKRRLIANATLTAGSFMIRLGLMLA